MIPFIVSVAMIHHQGGRQWALLAPGPADSETHIPSPRDESALYPESQTVLPQVASPPSQAAAPQTLLNGAQGRPRDSLIQSRSRSSPSKREPCAVARSGDSTADSSQHGEAFPEPGTFGPPTHLSES